jgi:hypothetical protein
MAAMAIAWAETVAGQPRKEKLYKVEHLAYAF